MLPYNGTADPFRVSQLPTNNSSGYTSRSPSEEEIKASSQAKVSHNTAIQPQKQSSNTTPYFNQERLDDTYHSALNKNTLNTCAPAGALDTVEPFQNQHMSSSPLPGMTSSSFPGISSSPLLGISSTTHPGMPSSTHPGMPSATHPGIPSATHPGLPSATHPGMSSATHPGMPSTEMNQNGVVSLPGGSVVSFHNFHKNCLVV